MLVWYVESTFKDEGEGAGHIDMRWETITECG
jgi:hypothetical protein